MKAAQTSQNSKWAEKLVPYFLSLLDEGEWEEGGLESEALNYWKGWDYSMGRESIASSLFEQFYVEFVRNIFLDEMGEELFKGYINQDLLGAYWMDKVRRTNESVWFDDISTDDKVETSSDIAQKSLKDAVNALEALLGKDISSWNWGKIHSLSLNHPLGSVDVLNKVFKLNKGPFPVGGSYHTVSPYSYPMDDLFNANHGSSQRHIYTTGNWDQSQVIIPTGVSGIPASPHYCDQTEDYLNYIYKTDLFSRELVEENKVYSMSFLGK